VRTRLPADITAIGPIVELQFEVPEAEYVSPAKKKAAKVRPAPAEAAEQSTEDGSPKKKSRPGTEGTEVSNTREIKERLTVWCRRLTTWIWMSTRQTLTHHRQRKQRIQNCFNNAIKSSRKNPRCLVKKHYFNNGMLLVRKQSHPYKHVCAQLQGSQSKSKSRKSLF
jgi:hypothetical protein